MKLGLIIGRFQPFHKGHLSLIEKAKAECDEILIILGSTNKLPDFKNPFTARERHELLKKHVDGFSIVWQPDKPTDDEWVQDVVASVLSKEEDPSQVTLYCHGKDEKWYRDNFIYPVETVNDIGISATQVRHAWYTSSLWTVEEYLTEETKEFLENHEDLNRLSLEYTLTQKSMAQKEEGHPFGNPMEPVSFAVIVQDNELIVGKRNGFRGKGQLGLLGGYLEKHETTLDGCIREVREESGIELDTLISSGQAKCLVQVVTENDDDIGTRTLGINYLFVVDPSVDLEITPDGDETTEVTKVPLREVLEDDTLLFYNHNYVVKAAFSKLGSLG